MGVQLADDLIGRFSVVVLDDKGNPTSAATPPTWAISDPTIATVAVDPADATGQSVLVTAQKPGTCQLTVSIAGTSLSASVEVDVVPSGPVSLSIGFSGTTPQSGLAGAPTPTVAPPSATTSAPAASTAPASTPTASAPTQDGSGS